MRDVPAEYDKNGADMRWKCHLFEWSHHSVSAIRVDRNTYTSIQGVALFSVGV